MIASVFIYGTLLCVAGQLDVPQPHSNRSTPTNLAPPPTSSRGPAASGTPVRGGAFSPPPTGGGVASGEFGLSGGSARDAAASSPTEFGNAGLGTFAASTGVTGGVTTGGANSGGMNSGGMNSGGMNSGGTVSRQPVASGYEVAPAGFSASSGLSGPNLVPGSNAGTTSVAAGTGRVGEPRPSVSVIVPLATTLAAAGAVTSSERATPAEGAAADRGALAARGVSAV